MGQLSALCSPAHEAFDLPLKDLHCYPHTHAFKHVDLTEQSAGTHIIQGFLPLTYFFENSNVLLNTYICDKYINNVTHTRIYTYMYIYVYIYTHHHVYM